MIQFVFNPFTGNFDAINTGTVTTLSVVTANGFAGTVATASTTPAITLTTTVTGILQGNGTAISAASTTGTGSVVLATSPTITSPSLSSTNINNVADPTTAQQAATKNYVDTMLAALNPATSVFAATAGSNIPGTYVPVAAGIGDTFTTTATGVFTVDGTTPALNARILIKDQSSGYQNGIYTITTLGSIGVPTIFTRAADYNTPADVNSAGLIPVINGTVNALSSWQQVANVTSIGPAGTALVFAEFTANPSLYLLKANNLSDVASNSAAFKNIAPLTTAGDLIYETAAPAPARLAIGSTGNVLTVVGGLPAWAPPATSGTVTSVAATVPAFLSISGSPITSSGTLALTYSGTALPVAQTTVPAQAVSASAIDWSTGSVFTKTLAANTTFTFSNSISGQTIVVRLTNTASNWTVTWPTVRWSGGAAPTMTGGAVSDIYTFVYDGSNIYGSAVQNMS